MSVGHHPLWQLVLFRIRGFLREPEALFWVFAFPLLTSLALGIAFRSQELPELAVAVADGPGAEQLTAALDAVDGLTASQMSEAASRDAMRRGKASLVILPGSPPQLVVDPKREEGRTARLMAVDAINRLQGRVDPVTPPLQEVTEPGSRYIDFLIPGLLGFGLLSSSLWGLGWALVQMRTGKLLKRLVATPMKRTHFLLSFLLSRSILSLVEILFFVVFARLLFDVRMAGSHLAFITLGLYGSLSFGGLALLAVCRAKTSEAASGLMNLVSMPMLLLSGVFFSASTFPEWMQPLVQFLPLTALNDGLRAIMIDGVSLFALWRQGLIMGVWGLLSFLVALRYFKWL
ncbi:ABC transporter permease [Stigmatella aurantiaca]|uniref:ABC transporter, permease protein, ABC-2 family n=1 Tax=Stigmatella aurantiaca (strain DW4/3-1) TaxID=378806 RepID=Q08SM1_STIAD|nr:ABC transporter permease [Stigmatella aurantiaca]ADO73822.1 ABC transporter, permease protein, ABC-2 family [Stigmatella aurantiaca DW4/3-1]EAU63474.1 ABC-2 type transporter family [Stigmatella aurantiaca DW4/3-1]